MLKVALPLPSVTSALLEHVTEMEDRELRIFNQLVLHLQLPQSTVKVFHHHIEVGLAQPFFEQGAVTGQNEIFDIEVFRNFCEGEADDVELVPLQNGQVGMREEHTETRVLYELGIETIYGLVQDRVAADLCKELVFVNLIPAVKYGSGPCRHRVRFDV
jgi:hypothetical protein